MKLIDLRTDDGSRHFTRLPKAASVEDLRVHLAAMEGVEIGESASNGTAQPHLEFSYRDHQFRIRFDRDHFDFFVHDPQCSDVHLYRVVLHCQKLLGGG